MTSSKSVLHDFLGAASTLTEHEGLPNVVADGPLSNIIPDSCSMKATILPGNKIHYHYEVEWTIDCNAANRSSTKKSVRNAVECADTPPGQLYTAIEKVSVPSCGGCVQDDNAMHKCDGPCGQFRPLKDFRILGRCDHAICSSCTVNASFVSQTDGSMGCCNRRCFALDIVAGIKDDTLRHEYYQKIFHDGNLDEIIALYKPPVSRKASIATVTTRSSIPASRVRSFISVSKDSYDDSETSSSSLSTTNLFSSGSELLYSPPGKGPIELILCRIIVFENTGLSSIKRYTYEGEIDLNTELIRAVEMFIGPAAGRNLRSAHTRLMVSTTRNMQMDTMYELIPKKHSHIPLRKFINERGTVDFLIDFTGSVIIGDHEIFRIAKK